MEYIVRHTRVTSATRFKSGQYCITNTFTSKVELLALHFCKNLQELLEEADKLFCQVIVVLTVY